MTTLAMRSYYRDDDAMLPPWQWLNGYTQARLHRDRDAGTLDTVIKRDVTDIAGRMYVTEQIVRVGA